MYKIFYKKSNLFFILALLICNISIVSAQNDAQAHVNNCIYATTTPYEFEAYTGQALDLRHATSSNLVIGCLDVNLSQQGRKSTQNMRLTLTLEAMYGGVPCPQISGYAIVPSGRSKQYTSTNDTYYLHEDPYTTSAITFTATPRAQIYDQC